MPSRPSTKVVTKWRRVCSPSVTMSMPARSWSRSTSRTASRQPSASASPSSSQGAHSRPGGASQAGLGRLPAIVVCRSLVMGELRGKGARGSGAGATARGHARGSDDYSRRPPAGPELVRPLDLPSPTKYGCASAPSTAFPSPAMPRVLFADYDFPDIELEREPVRRRRRRARHRPVPDRGRGDRRRARLRGDPQPVRADHRARPRRAARVGHRQPDRRRLRHHRHRGLREARRVGRAIRPTTASARSRRTRWRWRWP